MTIHFIKLLKSDDNNGVIGIFRAHFLCSLFQTGFIKKVSSILSYVIVAKHLDESKYTYLFLHCHPFL